MTSTTTRTFVLIPGAWMGGWVWDDLAAQLRERGHTVYAPTLVGLDEGARETGDVRLTTHVEQVVALLNEEDVSDAILVGHSYSGLVAGEVADRRLERVSHTVFVQAFLPRDGRSLIDDWSNDPAARAQEIASIAAHGGTWEAPIAGLAAEADLSPAQRKWLAARFVDHPGRTITDPPG